MGRLRTLHLPGLDVPIRDSVPLIRCARAGCARTTVRDVRMGDSLPRPSDLGWYEVQLEGRQRTTLFACSKACAQAVGATMVNPDAVAMSDRPVLNDGQAPSRLLLPTGEPYVPHEHAEPVAHEGERPEQQPMEQAAGQQ